MKHESITTHPTACGLGALLLALGACAPAPAPAAAPAAPPPPAPVAPAAAPAPPPATAAPAPPPPPAPVLVVKDVGLLAPESVLHDAESDTYLVSNVNGKPLDADRNGFISRIGPDGKVAELKWIDGSKTGSTLDAPKGMAVSGATLYVADITWIRLFDRKTGAPKGKLAVKGATFLNDVAVAPDGVIYVTDTGWKAGAQGFEGTGTDAVFRIDPKTVVPAPLLRDKVLADFSEMWPEKFTNVTNGVTPRRFVRQANPFLSKLITDTIGVGWVANLERVRELETYAEDPEFRAKFREVKAANKTRIAAVLERRDGILLPEDHLLDVMVKRLHEYKRQMLKLLHIVTLYEGIISGDLDPATVTPRTVVFGAKAAPGYRMAKEIIFLINSVASVINNDPRVQGKLFIAFPANYNVTLAERLIPAADLSEQISLAGKEASGTGNMKFALNGALTIGTDDGANVEIRKLVGDDNFFLFGMTEPEVADLQARGYRPTEYYESNEKLRRAINLIDSGHFTGGNREAASMVVGDLLYNDRFLVLADYQAYLDAQAEVEAAYADQEAWSRSAILNVARTGFFSSDRSMRDYINRIWHIRTGF